MKTALAVVIVLMSVGVSAFAQNKKSCPTPTETLQPIPDIQPIHTQKTCTTVDLSGQLPGVRDQGNTHWCYAMQLADMLSAQMHRVISGADIAIAYQNNDPETHAKQLKNVTDPCRDNTDLLTDAGAGESSDAFKALKKVGGACPNANLPTPSGFDEAIMKVEKSLSKSPDTGDRQCPDSALHTLSPLSDLQKTERQMYKAPVWQAYSKIAAVACKGHRIPIPANLAFKEVTLNELSDLNGNKMKYLDQYRQARNGIDSLLNNHRVVGYDSFFYFDHIDSTVYAKHFTLASDSHSTTIIGRHWDSESKTCKYTIRNNWGMDACNQSGFFERVRQCDPGSDVCKMVTLPGHYNCDRKTGNISLSESELLGALYQYTYLSTGHQKSK